MKQALEHAKALIESLVSRLPDDYFKDRPADSQYVGGTLLKIDSALKAMPDTVTIPTAFLEEIRKWVLGTRKDGTALLNKLDDAIDASTETSPGGES